MQIRFGLTRLLLWEHPVEKGMEHLRYTVAGTGFLVKYYRSYLLVTAKHVWFKDGDFPKNFTILDRLEKNVITTLGIVRHANLRTEKEGQAAEDVSIFEINTDSHHLLRGVSIPDIDTMGIDCDPVIGIPVIAQGFPDRLREPIIDHEAGDFMPRRLDLEGIYIGKGVFSALRKMSLNNARVTLSPLTEPLEFPKHLNGMCGGPVFSNVQRKNRLLGMTIMAGSDSLQFIEIELIAKMIRYVVYHSAGSPPLGHPGES